uniref:Thioredoxin domain-containing protein n=1 Tax=Globodera rostochiensis TaxID=31243 RepID=A0A914I7U8_GLORO
MARIVLLLCVLVGLFHIAVVWSSEQLPKIVEEENALKKPGRVSVVESLKLCKVDAAVHPELASNFEVRAYAVWSSEQLPKIVKEENAVKKVGHSQKLSNVDVAVHPELASNFEVRAYPTLKLFKNGKPAEHRGGRVAASSLESADSRDDLEEANSWKCNAVLLALIWGALFITSPSSVVQCGRSGGGGGRGKGSGSSSTSGGRGGGGSSGGGSRQRGGGSGRGGRGGAGRGGRGGGRRVNNANEEEEEEV